MITNRKKYKLQWLIITLAFCYNNIILISANEIKTDKFFSGLDQVVADACDKQVVLIGEDGHHGSGKTISVKIDLLKRLIDDCGFSAVFFESQIYDFIGLDQAIANKAATPKQLADAIGGLWSTTQEIDSLITYLFNKVITGNLKLAGLDLQVGGATNYFTQRKLAELLTQYLKGNRLVQCKDEIHQHINWTYDDTSPYNTQTKERLKTCSNDIDLSIAKQKSFVSSKNIEVMAANFSQYLGMSDGNGANKRDAKMYDNFVWHQSHLPKNTKIIVWTATVHAAKNLSSISKERIPLGNYLHKLLKDSVFSIGFSAISGSYANMMKKAIQLQKQAKGSLENFASTKIANEPLYYLNKQSLKTLGKVSSHTLMYNNSKIANWDEILDGIIVLANEHPPHYIRSAKPQQKLE